MPGTLRKLYARTLDELEAAEQLMELEAAAFPHLKKQDSQRIHRRYERIIRVRQRLNASPQEKPKLTAHEAAERARSMGIKVVTRGA